MKIWQLLILFSSLFALEFNADAGDDISKLVSPCRSTSIQLNGNFVIDALGVCDTGFCSDQIVCDDGSGSNDGYDCNGYCIADNGYDCNGICGGSDEDDECGICTGDNSTCTDCNGVINGNAYTDGCGDCVEDELVCDDGSSLNDADCIDQVEGEFCNDGNNQCEYQIAACDTDCNGVINGNAYTNGCGDCVEDELVCNDGSSLNDADCIDQVEGDLCNNENNQCEYQEISCIQGCDGNWSNNGSELINDDCGICAGDNSTCTGCLDNAACNYSPDSTIGDDSCSYPDENYELILESECNEATYGSGAAAIWVTFSDIDYIYSWSSDNMEVTFINNGTSSPTVIVPELNSATNIDIYLSVSNQYLEEPSIQDTMIVFVDPVIPCANAGTEIRENCLSCLNENSSIYNLGVGKCDIMKICEPVALICDDLSGINDADCFYQSEGDFCNDANNQCAFALCEIENVSECVDNDGNWVPISEYHNNKSDGYYLLNPFDSYDTYGLDLEYTWEISELFSIDLDHRISIIDASQIRHTKYPVVLTASNGTYESFDTTYLNFNISAPIIPTIYAKADSGKIIINWTSEGMNSVDSLTGYRDFEGFRIYKSTDGGATWGGPDDRIYYNGEAKGWNPLAQFDLSVEEDSLFSLKDIDYEIDEEDMVCTGDLITSCASDQQCENNGKCTNPNLRFTRISGIDPLAPWMNLGENTGLEYTYTDNDVYNGKEYTYAVVSYDMGLRSYELSYVTPDDNSGICTAFDNSETMTTEEACCTSNSGAWDSELDRCTYLDCSECSWEELFNQVQDWDVTNPDHFSDSDGNGYASVECDITEINKVTAIPGFYAENVENISFEGVENADGIILQAEDQTVGNGLKSFMIVNQDDLTESVYRFEIQADYLLDTQGNTEDVFGGYATGAPSLYVYEIKSIVDTSPMNYTSYELTEENFSDIILGLSLEAKLLDKGYSYCNPSDEDYDGDQADDCISILNDMMLDLPGSESPQDGEYRIPIYKFENFPLNYSDELGYTTNFTSFIDGLKFRFDNSLSAIPSDGVVAVNSLKYVYTNDSGDRDTVIFQNSPSLKFQMEYGNNGDSFNKRPPYSYSIKFSTEPIYEAAKTIPASACSSPNPGNTLLPFEITNLTTGKVVGVWHLDEGTRYKDLDLYDNCTETCSSTQWCNNGTCKELIGVKDCYWEPGEKIAFKLDEISTLTQSISEEYTFDLYADFGIFYGADYDSSITYSTGDYVKRNGMLWQAMSSISANNEPTLWIDSDEDGVNENPWKPVYAGRNGSWWNDGDELIIEPTNWYADGDAWIADFSQIGLKTDINEDDLSKISVVPNPYFSHSRFDETATSRLMWFTHLPTLCDISIFTISGELVTTLEHNSEFSGQESWDLRSGNGDEVAPGLYIYTVEAGNDDKFKHIGKFAIVR